MADGATLIAQSLKRQGAEYMFGIFGIPIIPVAVMAQTLGLQYFGMRNEQAASYAAGAIGYLTQKPGICLTVSGPGVIHGLAGVANAWANCWPMILIGGANPTIQNSTGAFQEAPQIESVRMYTKYAARIESTSRIPFYIEKAFRASLYGRPGPVYLDIPDEVITGTANEDSLLSVSVCPPPPVSLADPSLVSRAIQLLRTAKNPLAIIGKGIAYSRAEKQMKQFVETTGIPFLPTPMGKGVLPDDHEQCVGAARTDALLNADLIFLFGARLNWILHFGLPPRYRPDRRFVQIDIEAEEIGNNVTPDVALVGDAGAILTQLNQELNKLPKFHFSPSSEWWASLRSSLDANKKKSLELGKDDRIPMSYYRTFQEIKQLLPPDAVIVSEGANTMDIGRSMLNNTFPRHRLDAGTFGTMGVGLGFAIAAAAVYPEKRVIAVEGDSAFGFSGMEFEVACRYKLPIIVLIVNNNGIYSGVSQLSEGDRPPVNVHLPGAQYEKIAEAFGGKGYFVNTPSQLSAALKDALSHRFPSIINIAIDPGSDRKQQKFQWLTQAKL